METIDVSAETHTFCDTLTDEQDEAARQLLSFIAGKWPLWVMHVLAESPGPMRFSQLQREVEGVSQKILTQTLRQLERNGLVTRKIFAQVPPRVEYALTPLGGSLLRQILPLWRWVAERIDQFEEAPKESKTVAE